MLQKRLTKKDRKTLKDERMLMTCLMQRQEVELYKFELLLRSILLSGSSANCSTDFGKCFE